MVKYLNGVNRSNKVIFSKVWNKKKFKCSCVTQLVYPYQRTYLMSITWTVINQIWIGSNSTKAKSIFGIVFGRVCWAQVKSLSWIIQMVEARSFPPKAWIMETCSWVVQWRNGIIHACFLTQIINRPTVNVYSKDEIVRNVWIASFSSALLYGICHRYAFKTITSYLIS